MPGSRHDVQNRNEMLRNGRRLCNERGKCQGHVKQHFNAIRSQYGPCEDHDRDRELSHEVGGDECEENACRCCNQQGRSEDRLPVGPTDEISIAEESLLSFVTRPRLVNSQPHL
jgi:hypothetical protein